MRKLWWGICVLASQGVQYQIMQWQAYKMCTITVATALHYQHQPPCSEKSHCCCVHTRMTSILSNPLEHLNCESKRAKNAEQLHVVFQSTIPHGVAWVALTYACVIVHQDGWRTSTKYGFLPLLKGTKKHVGKKWWYSWCRCLDHGSSRIRAYGQNYETLHITQARTQGGAC